jgi:Condensation domain/TubC N-terminal docking domain
MEGDLKSVPALLRDFRSRGVRLWAQHGQLRYSAPRGALSLEDIGWLRESKDQIVAFFEATLLRESSFVRPSSAERPTSVPLSHSQLAHWNLYQLSERRNVRQLATVCRLRGQLQVDVLREALTCVIHRHDALRTRIVTHDGAPVQKVYDRCDCELEIADLASVEDRSREAEAHRCLEEFLLERVDVSLEPLAGAKLLKIGPRESLLIVAMEHSISDAVSVAITVDELLSTYEQILRGDSLSLPPVAQFIDFARWQSASESSWVERHGEYWAHRLAGCDRVRFPFEASEYRGKLAGWEVAPIEFGSTLKTQLGAWCKRAQTTPPIAMLTAYVALVMRWCNMREVVIPYVVDGRDDPALERAVGYFASVLYLRIERRPDDRFIDLAARVMDEYRQAVLHADASYVEAQLPKREFTRNSGFNWVYAGKLTRQSYENDSEGTLLVRSPVNFTHPMVKDLERNTEPFLLLMDADDVILGGLYFPRYRQSLGSMERFGRNLQGFVQEMLRNSDERVATLNLI